MSQKNQTSQSVRRGGGLQSITQRRLRIMMGLIAVIVLVLVGRLAWVQLAWGPELAAQAQEQRARVYVEPARRGTIYDHVGKELAYTHQARSLTVSPNMLRSELRQQAETTLATEGELSGLDDSARAERIDNWVADVMVDMSERIPEMIEGSGLPIPQAESDSEDDDNVADTSSVKSEEILEKLNADSTYEVLVRNVDPDVAFDVAREFHGVAADHQDIRQYPNGAVAENILGKVSVDGLGQFGFEASQDEILTGQNGRSTEDVATTGQIIPGTLRDEVAAVDGNDVYLTLDLDLQTFVQQKIEQAKENSGAQHAEAVVLDVQTGEILAMANSDTVNPNLNIERQIAEGKSFENATISHPYEPGSVAKIITAAAAINEGLTTPDEVHHVPGSIDMAGVTVKDAWVHGGTNFTTTGIFGKSSNVGTLMLAQRLGEETFNQYLQDFGIGQTTGVELPSESPGLLPALENWGGGTFANLPIGQGMSWTTLQMASVFQTVANEGQRIEPRIIDSVMDENGDPIDMDEAPRSQVISPEAAKTVVEMFRSTMQADPAGGAQSGTAGGWGLDGYQSSGKTGTAQKVNPETGAYSMSDYWITFAGIAPADDPRFVVAVMLDDPERGTQEGGAGGQSAAPVFHDIASWLLDRENIAPSPEGEVLVLQAG